MKPFPDKLHSHALSVACRTITSIKLQDSKCLTCDSGTGPCALQGPLSTQHPWLWKEIRLGKTSEASFDVSDDRHLMDPDQPCEDCSSAAPRMGIPLKQLDLP